MITQLAGLAGPGPQAEAWSHCKKYIGKWNEQEWPVLKASAFFTIVGLQQLSTASAVLLKLQ